MHLVGSMFMLFGAAAGTAWPGEFLRLTTWHQRVPSRGLVAGRQHLRDERPAVQPRGHAGWPSRSNSPALHEWASTSCGLMPVQPIGVKNRKGALGSYDSVRDYPR